MQTYIKKVFRILNFVCAPRANSYNQFWASSAKGACSCLWEEILVTRCHTIESIKVKISLGKSLFLILRRATRAESHTQLFSFLGKMIEFLLVPRRNTGNAIAYNRYKSMLKQQKDIQFYQQLFQRPWRNGISLLWRRNCFNGNNKMNIKV